MATPVACHFSGLDIRNAADQPVIASQRFELHESSRQVSTRLRKQAASQSRPAEMPNRRDCETGGNDIGRFTIGGNANQSLIARSHIKVAAASRVAIRK